MAAQIPAIIAAQAASAAFKPEATKKLHEPAVKAEGAEHVAYQQTLGDIDQTTATIDNVFAVVTPKRLFTLMLMLLMLLFVYRLFRSQINGVLKKIWDALADPFRKRQQQHEAEASLEAKGADMSTPATLTEAEAANIADTIAGAFSWWNDKETVIYTALRSIRNDRDLALVVAAYRTRPISLNIWSKKKDLDFWGSLGSLDKDEIERCRSILMSNGITPGLIVI